MGGVVNGQLVVYGTQNLRVADASIMPLHIATHTQQTVYAIAEKVSDFWT
jgi:choline dehydrogenase-like flavoprotein